MKIYLATWIMEKSQKESLDIQDNENRLMSYHFISTSNENLKDYMEDK